MGSRRWNYFLKNRLITTHTPVKILITMTLMEKHDCNPCPKKRCNPDKPINPIYHCGHNRQNQYNLSNQKYFVDLATLHHAPIVFDDVHENLLLKIVFSIDPKRLANNRKKNKDPLVFVFLPIDNVLRCGDGMWCGEGGSRASPTNIFQSNTHQLQPDVAPPFDKLRTMHHQLQPDVAPQFRHL